MAKTNIARQPNPRRRSSSLGLQSLNHQVMTSQHRRPQSTVKSPKKNKSDNHPERVWGISHVLAVQFDDWHVTQMGHNMSDDAGVARPSFGSTHDLLVPWLAASHLEFDMRDPRRSMCKNHNATCIVFYCFPQGGARNLDFVWFCQSSECSMCCWIFRNAFYPAPPKNLNV